jgi:hypothetical protein
LNQAKIFPGAHTTFDVVVKLEDWEPFDEVIEIESEKAPSINIRAFAMLIGMRKIH